MSKYLTIQDQYNAMVQDRRPYLDRARDYASYTLPYIMPLEGTTGASTQVHDWQSIGARGVSHLANKYMMAMFPASRPFFRLKLTDDAKSMAAESNSVEKLELAMATLEQKGHEVSQSAHNRTALVLAIKHLIITGNVVLFSTATKEKMRVYPLSRFVIKRDLADNVLTLITLDEKALETFPIEMQTQIKSERKSRGEDLDEENVKLYTKINQVDDEMYEVIQEAEGIPVLSSYGLMKAEDLYWIPLGWNRNAGEDYARGLIEDHAGAFHALSILTSQMVKVAAKAGDMKYGVRPSSVVDIVRLNESDPFTYHSAEEGDVFAFDTAANNNSWTVIKEIVQGYERSLGYVFLLNSAVTRASERTTAEEIRIQVEELETAHAGSFSALAEELQLPLARLYLKQVDKSIGSKDNQIARPQIITGIEAMSRNSDLNKIRVWLQDLSLLNTVPEDVRATLKLNAIAKNMAVDGGIDYRDVIKTDEQIAAEQQAAQQAAMQQQLATEASKALPTALNQV